MMIQDTESFYKRQISKIGLAMIGVGLILDEGFGQRLLVAAGASLIMLTLLDYWNRRAIS
tara:strand:- start:239 stop:418 length:180 start_codon:yes stop_codon:yes gene_type:complete